MSALNVVKQRDRVVLGIDGAVCWDRSAIAWKIGPAEENSVDQRL
jgi:hypothetical protein